jgi:hypothetical protein
MEELSIRQRGKASSNKKARLLFVKFSRARRGSQPVIHQAFAIKLPEYPFPIGPFPTSTTTATTTTFVNLSERYGAIVVGKFCCWNSLCHPANLSLSDRA